MLDRLLNIEYENVSACNDAARNIEIFHEVSGSNKRNRDGDRIQGRTQSNDYKGNSGRSYDSRGQVDRIYDQRGQSGGNVDTGRPETRSQDNRNAGRNGNDR